MKRSPRIVFFLVCALSLWACAGSETIEQGKSMTEIEAEVGQALTELVDGGGDATQSLSGLAVAVLRKGEVSFEATFGRAYIDPEGLQDRALTPSSLVRIASISKTLSAIVVMQLVEQGDLELDGDVSDYLGWQIRNPSYPDRAITLRQLLSHTSSIRDAGESYIIRYPRALREAFDPDGADFAERFQTFEDGVDRGPGVFFEYANLNYGVIGTVLEIVTGTRFDRLLKERVFEVLGIQGGFNVAELSEEEQGNLATLYRKRDQEEVWHPEGKWVAQVDDLTQGIPTALPDDADYRPGTNGAQFSPQGGARMSLKGLEALSKLFLGDGSVRGVRILSPESMAELRSPAWTYDPEAGNLDDYDGTLNAFGPGLRIITSKTEGDRLFIGDTRRWFGHFGEAYGLLAGAFVHPESGDGVILALTGSSFDPHEESTLASTLAPIESRILQILEKLLDSPPDPA